MTEPDFGGCIRCDFYPAVADSLYCQRCLDAMRWSVGEQIPLRFGPLRRVERVETRSEYV